MNLESIFLNEPIGIGRRKYEYQKHISNSQRSYSLKAEDNEFPFPKKWYKNIGYTINGFSFTFINAPDN